MGAATKLDDLAQKVSRWSAAMRSADTGPLVIAQEVVAVVDSWDVYKHEAGDITAQSWLEAKVFRPGLGTRFWRTRARAVEHLGEAVRRTMHHEAAVWVVESVPEDQRSALVFRVHQESKRISAPVPRSTVQRLYRAMAGVKPKPKTCGECARLRAKMLAAGIDPDA